MSFPDPNNNPGRRCALWRPMVQADKKKRLVVVTLDGKLGIAYWEECEHLMHPKPFWKIEGRSVAKSRKYPPAYWLEFDEIPKIELFQDQDLPLGK